MSRRIKPAEEANDGSDGAWSRGLPREVDGLPSSSKINYDPQAGCPREYSGGSYAPNVAGMPDPSAAQTVKPFKLGK